MEDDRLSSYVYFYEGISMTTIYILLSEGEGPSPGPLVQNMVNIGPGPVAPHSQS